VRGVLLLKGAAKTAVTTVTITSPAAEMRLAEAKLTGVRIKTMAAAELPEQCVEREDV
jgi:hypothetical protein